MKAAYFFILRDKGQITSEEFLKIEERERQPLSLHSDLNWIPYLAAGQVHPATFDSF